MNLWLIQNTGYWVTKLEEFKPCPGAVAALRRQAGQQQQQPLRTGTHCPVGMKLSLETSLLERGSRRVKIGDRERLAFVLRFHPRCIHCQLEKLRGKPIPLPQHKSTCDIKSCSRLRWQRVGSYCDLHYRFYFMAWTGIHRDNSATLEIPKALLSDTPRILQRLADETFRFGPYLTKFTRVLLDESPEAPRIFALDTEFTIKKDILEIAILDVRTGRLTVDAVFDTKQRVDSNMKLSFVRMKPDFQLNPNAQHAQQVSTISQGIQQIVNCDFRPTDIFVEYSPTRHTPLDLGNLRQFLKTNSPELLLHTLDVQSYACISDIRSSPVCRDILNLPRHNLSLLFAVLFPEHPLVFQGHSAAVDVIQMTHILRLFAELSRPKGQRSLPTYLLRGLGRVFSSEQ